MNFIPSATQFSYDNVTKLKLDISSTDVLDKFPKTRPY